MIQSEDTQEKEGIGAKGKQPMKIQIAKEKAFPNKQIISLIKLLKKIITKYEIKINNVLGHSDISPGRKFDPGPLFPWSKIRQNKTLKKA